MKDIPESERPLSEQYRIVAKQYATAKKAANFLDSMKGSELAKRIKAMQLEEPGLAYNKAEMEVKASDDWQDYLRALVDAQDEMDRRRLQMEYIKMRFTEWTEGNANLRHEARLVRG